MLKTLVGRGHPEFSTNHQQDAQEFFLHLIDLTEKSEENSKLKECFAFQVYYVILLYIFFFFINFI